MKTKLSAVEVSSALAKFETRGSRFAFNVKVHSGPADLSEETFEELRSELGLETARLDGLPFGAEWIESNFAKDPDSFYSAQQFATDDAWAEAREFVEQTFWKGVLLDSEGRSGGWATLHGIDAADAIAAARAFARFDDLKETVRNARALGNATTLASAESALFDAAEEAFGYTFACELQSVIDGTLSICAYCGAELKGSVGPDGASYCSKAPNESPSHRKALPEELGGDLHGSTFSMKELRELVIALEEFSQYCSQVVENFPWRVAWQLGANVFERQWEKQREEEELGEAVETLINAAEWDGELGPIQSATRKLRELAGSRVTLRLPKELR